MALESTIVELLAADLMTGERVLWTGRPARAVIFHASDAYAIPFSLLWGGFAIFWEATVLGFWGSGGGREAPWFFVIWGIPFVLIGQYMIWGRFFYTFWKKKKVLYAITNRRA